MRKSHLRHPKIHWLSQIPKYATTLLTTLLTHCQPPPPKTPSPQSQETFSYRKWQNPKHTPNIIIIALHGFDGTSLDYKNLGSYLQQHSPNIALYAYEIRGQGNDPLQSRRGDIIQPQDWYRDLNTFTKLIHQQHPNAKIIWMGESMGALITTHAYACYNQAHPPCQGIILSSPVVSLEKHIPNWLPPVFQIIAQTFPNTRIPIDALANSQQINNTENTQFNSQAKTNPYHVSSHTLRLLGTLSQKIHNMPKIAPKLHCPTLTLYGDKDWFTSPQQLQSFTSKLPPHTPHLTHTYHNAYHLLMYDKQKQHIFHDIQHWLNHTFTP